MSLLVWSCRYVAYSSRIIDISAGDIVLADLTLWSMPDLDDLFFIDDRVIAKSLPPYRIEVGLVR